ncbi:MAG TPA: HAMP domain-containing sensor histidine kinase, partial [Roseiflexaceae bacterium]|nr:HAMP domain-containing sensor histidine kinase [Roseiflexaceae bacterium]
EARLHMLLAEQAALHQETLAALAAARAEAEAAQQVRAAFLGVMSHELRTPLASIIGYGELIQRDLQQGMHEQIDHDVDRILAASSHLLSLINQVLELGDLEQQRVDYRYRDVDLFLLVHTLLERLQPLAQQNGNTIRMLLDESAYRVRTDPEKLEKIVYHILHNAVKFTSHGSISIRASAMGAWLCVYITDTGMGIDQEQLAHLFDAFTIGDASSTRSYGGAGIGLALSYRLCQLLHGQIEVASQPGSGSTFTIRIPRSPSATMPTR